MTERSGQAGDMGMGTGMGMHEDAQQQTPTADTAAGEADDSRHATTATTTTRTISSVTLLAPRLRVEERQLQVAFRARGIATAHVDAENVSLSVTGGLGDGGNPFSSSIAMDRAVATEERATLAALLTAQTGMLVVNRAATTRLLADRLALLRHLDVANLPLPATIVAFSEASAVAALDEIGVPVLLQSRSVQPSLPDVVAHDRDTAEALLEHRAMLAGQTLTLLQTYVPGPTLRAVIVGTTVLGIETLTHVAGSTSGMTFAPYTGDDAARAAVLTLVQAVVARLGSGVYDVKVVLGPDGPVVVAAGNLVDFRSLSASGIDVAGAIVEWVLTTATAPAPATPTATADGARG